MQHEAHDVGLREGRGADAGRAEGRAGPAAVPRWGACPGLSMQWELPEGTDTGEGGARWKALFLGQRPGLVAEEREGKGFTIHSAQPAALGN